jgi:hypothetical protein
MKLNKETVIEVALVAKSGKTIKPMVAEKRVIKARATIGFVP